MNDHATIGRQLTGRELAELPPEQRAAVEAMRTAFAPVAAAAAAYRAQGYRSQGRKVVRA
jgi:hypothetical protein